MTCARGPRPITHHSSRHERARAPSGRARQSIPTIATSSRASCIRIRGTGGADSRVADAAAGRDVRSSWTRRLRAPTCSCRIRSRLPRPIVAQLRRSAVGLHGARADVVLFDHRSTCAAAGAASRAVAPLRHRSTDVWHDGWPIARRGAGWRRSTASVRRMGLATVANPLLDGQFSPTLNAGAVLTGSRRAAARLAGARRRRRASSSTTAATPCPPTLEEFLSNGEPPVVFTLGSSAVGAAGTVLCGERRRRRAARRSGAAHDRRFVRRTSRWRHQADSCTVPSRRIRRCSRGPR